MSNEADVWWKPTHQRAAKSLAQFTISETFQRVPPPPPVKRGSKHSSTSSPDASQPSSPESSLQLIAQVALSGDSPTPKISNAASPASPTSRKRARSDTTFSDAPPPYKKKNTKPTTKNPTRKRSAENPPKKSKKNRETSGHKNESSTAHPSISSRPTPSRKKNQNVKVEGESEASWGADERGVILSIFGSLYPSEEETDSEEEEEVSSGVGTSDEDEEMSDGALLHSEESSDASDFSEPGSPFLTSESDVDELKPPDGLDDELLALSLPRTRARSTTRTRGTTKPSLSTISAEIDAITAEPPRRGRGRPRKNALPVDLPARSTSSPTPPRRGRGRPPKNAARKKPPAKKREVFTSTTDEESSDDGSDYDNEPLELDDDHSEDPHDAPPQEEEDDDDEELQSDDTEDEDELGDPNKPPAYGPIRRNVYVGIKPPKEVRSEQCQCWYLPNIPDMACGTNCMNRLGLEECYPNNCPCGDHCMNQRFQKLQYSDLKVVRTNKKGFGVLAERDITRGDFVIEYVGEVIDHDVFQQRMNKRQGQKNYYIITVGSGRYVDATYKGNIARFINHSCEPNCKPEIWHVRGHRCVGIFALKDIKAGEEVTFDYQFERIGSAKQKCYCGQPTCRGFLGARKPLSRPPKSPTPSDSKDKGKSKAKSRPGRRKGTPTRSQPQAKPIASPPPIEVYHDTSPLPTAGPTTRRSWTRMLHSATQNSLDDMRNQRTTRRSSRADAL